MAEIEQEFFDLDEKDVSILERILKLEDAPIAEFLKIEGIDYSRFKAYVDEAGLNDDEECKKILKELEVAGIPQKAQVDDEYPIIIRTADSKLVREWIDIYSRTLYPEIFLSLSSLNQRDIAINSKIEGRFLRLFIYNLVSFILIKSLTETKILSDIFTIIYKNRVLKFDLKMPESEVLRTVNELFEE